MAEEYIKWASGPSEGRGTSEGTLVEELSALLQFFQLLDPYKEKPELCLMDFMAEGTAKRFLVLPARSRKIATDNSKLIKVRSIIKGWRKETFKYVFVLHIVFV